MQSKYLIALISLLFISSINSIDISILKGEKLFNQNTPIIVNIVSEEIQEKNSNVELICVIDVSGSMMGEKIKLVKQSLKVLLEMMGANDKLGLVLFNHQAEKLLDLTFTTSENKKMINGLIDKIQARGGTYILGGLEIAVNMFKSSSNEPKSNSDKFISSAIILLSDGVDNRMNHIEIGNGLKALTKETNLGFTLHAFGYGNDHDPKIMNSLATIRDGSFYFVQEYKKVAEYFVNVLGACVSMVSEKAKISIKTRYKIMKMYGLGDLFTYQLKDTYFETELLQLIAGKEYTYVFEMEIPDDKYNEDDFVDVEFYYNNKEGNKVIKKNQIEKMDEMKKEKANEEYLRMVVFENMNEAANLREANKKKEAEDKLSKMKDWLNLNYRGKEDYMTDINGSLELIKNDILYEQQGFATMTSNAREGRMKRGGTSMKYQNAIQRDMVNSLHMA
jgi:Mg-chelatase subunit ChlD